MLLFARHGATDFNVQQKWMGGMDMPLNRDGLLQSRKLADELSHYKLSKIYSSPLERARSTALEIQKHNSSAPIFIIDDLRERSLGEFEGLEKSPENYKKMIRSNSIEPIKNLQQRLEKALYNIEKDETVLIVSHSAVFRCLINEMGYRSEPEIDRLENCQCVRLIPPRKAEL